MPFPTDTGWPMLLDDRALANMLTVTKPALRRLVRQGHIPVPRILGGLERWHRDEVAVHLGRTWGLDDADRQRAEQAQAAGAALNGWKTKTRRGASRG